MNQVNRLSRKLSQILSVGEKANITSATILSGNCQPMLPRTQCNFVFRKVMEMKIGYMLFLVLRSDFRF